MEDENQDNIEKLLRDMNQEESDHHEEFPDLTVDQGCALENEPFGPDSPIRILKLSREECRSIPLFNQLHYLVSLIADSEELKLTEKGFLPMKIVAELYAQKLMRDEFARHNQTKRLRESDIPTIMLVRILLLEMGLLKKRNNRLSLTQKAKKVLADYNLFLRLMIDTYGCKFRWFTFDHYGNPGMVQFGLGYTLLLLHRYGDEKRSTEFYADKYFGEFPFLLIMDSSGQMMERRWANSCYAFRSFEQFASNLGIVEMDERRLFSGPRRVWKSDLFERVFGIGI